ncbi:class A beta-lactamase [Pararhizobium sp. BT-229]|uniref:class A beta-lactamase n=1 Tax=Pararhizobium sp. BT-229 TaxID=2986923 RepID=UPI0021F6B234|nr:class A beta-lactamase [Pararhizobium sp. BT-229]MCV9963393.1 class A beta-lactamase [Pararhizobium sp. BT-229]
MPLTLRRRSFLIASSLLLPVTGLGAGTAFAAEKKIEEQLAALEKRTGGRLGVFVLDTRTNASFAHRQDERFAMCSTFKALAAAFALARVDKGEETLDRRIAVSKKDLLSYSPIVEKRVGGGMTVRELCDAAVTYSDNAAANLLLASFGGPEGLTAWLRSIGDETTRLDRTEPELNEAKVGDPRDTTTPAAMTRTLGRLLLEDVLSPSSRDQFAAWLVANTTGDRRLRAGLPGGWTVGEKTGTSGHGEAGDIGFMRPRDGHTILASVYIAEGKKPTKDLEPIFAEVGKLIGAMA